MSIISSEGLRPMLEQSLLAIGLYIVTYDAKAKERILFAVLSCREAAMLSCQGAQSGACRGLPVAVVRDESANARQRDRLEICYR